MKEDEEHIVTEREKRAWQAGKKRKTRERPKLNIVQKIEFLKMFARMAPHAEYERRLSLEPNDVEYYRNLLDVESASEARRMAKQLDRNNQERHEATVIEQTKQVRDAEAIAQKRLEEIEAKRNAIKPVRTVNQNAIKNEDAERQRRWASQQNEVQTPVKTWNLPVDGTEARRVEQVERFRREIMYRGMNFVRNKYNVTNAQIKHEASRLGLVINWDIVRR